jgi:hypothetical protein
MLNILPQKILNVNKKYIPPIVKSPETMYNVTERRRVPAASPNSKERIGYFNEQNFLFP